MADPVHILITGGTGQVGLELQALAWPDGIVLHAPTRAELDLSDAASICAVFAADTFDAVINCGAYTSVDKAESNVAGAFAANALGPAVLADLTREVGIPLVQVSTDYVFPGSKDGLYVETDPVGPLNVYGASKLAGEMAVRNGNPRSVVLRTAWLLSVHRVNFLKTMLRVASEQPALRVVGDQYGCPTSARDVAAALKTITLTMIDHIDAPTGIYQFASAGQTTWADLAREIFALSGAQGGPSATVDAISASGYPTAAARPSNSRLSTDKLNRDFGIAPRSWQAAVAEIVLELCSERKRS